LGPSLNALAFAGIVLFFLGAVRLAIPVFSKQDTKNIAKLGDLKLQTTETAPHSIPPLPSGGALAPGVVLIAAGVSRTIRPHEPFRAGGNS
jgi:hypothetical protein